ncbi:MAG: 4a-hydroxytetrahydrobiopterin dehydratase [Acidimicrobiia bacterium]
MPTDLSHDQLHEFFNSYDWDREGESISKTYAFSDFSEAMGFVTRVAIASDVADHHPDIDVRWNKVTLVLSTHSEGALTSKDLTLAAEFDGFVRD